MVQVLGKFKAFRVPLATVRKKLLLLLLPAVWFSCSDGDLQIGVIDFDQETMQFCGSADTSTELLFKISENEALILDLQSGLLENEASTDTLLSSIPGQSQLIYRTFSEEVNKAYFCDPFPPATPVVSEEIQAGAGNVRIFTSRNETDTTLYQHNIRLEGISFVNDAGERITNLSVDNFGTLETSN
jgi:hypothetical protein